jgi:hypothetical protein
MRSDLHACNHRETIVVLAFARVQVAAREVLDAFASMQTPSRNDVPGFASTHARIAMGHGEFGC